MFYSNLTYYDCLDLPICSQTFYKVFIPQCVLKWASVTLNSEPL